MAKKYQVNRRIRIINRLMTRMIHWNIAPPRTYLMIWSRKTSKPYTMPITLVERDGKRWMDDSVGLGLCPHFLSPSPKALGITTKELMNL